MAVIRPSHHRVRDHPQAPVQEADHGELSGPEVPDVPEIPRQTGADARRERPREVRRLRPVLGGVPGRRDLPRGGRERRHACRPGRATRRSTRSTRRAASSAATAKKPARSAAIFMGKDYELAVYSKDDFIWDKTDLLVPATTPKRLSAAGDGAGRARSSEPTAMQIGALGDIHGAFDTRPAASWRGIPTCRSGSASATSRATTASTSSRSRAALLDQGQQRGLRRDRRRGERPPAPTLHYLPNGGPHDGRAVARRGLGGTFAPSWYHTPAAALPHPRTKGDARSATELRRQAPALRARRSRWRARRCTSIDVFLTHEAPRPFSPGAGRADRRRQDGDQRGARGDAAAAAPVRPPSPVHRHGASGRPLDRPRPRHAVVPADRRGRRCEYRADRHVERSP